MKDVNEDRMKAILTRIKGGMLDKKEPQTLGVLQVFDGLKKIFECNTLEKPWLDNMSGKSCIFDGSYLVKKWHSEEAKKVGKSVIYNHFEIENVFGRKGILIHIGNYVEQIHGCVLVGSSFVDINGDGVLDLKDSGAVLAELFKLMPNNFRLTIKSI